MASSTTTFTAIPTSLCNTNRGRSCHTFTLPSATSNAGARSLPRRSARNAATISAKYGKKNALQYRKLGDSDLEISEITLGTVMILIFSEMLCSEIPYRVILTFCFLVVVVFVVVCIYCR